MVPTLLRNHRETLRSRTPNQPARFQTRGDVQRGARPGLGLEGARRCRELAGQRREAGLEIGPRELRHRAGPADQFKNRVNRLFPRAGHSDDLLADDIQRRGDRAQRLDPAGPSGPRRDQGTDQLAGRRGQQEPPRCDTSPMARSPDSLEATGYSARQPDLDRHVGGADVHAELQAGARHDGTNRARLQPRFDRASPLRVERGVMRGDDEFRAVGRTGRAGRDGCRRSYSIGCLTAGGMGCGIVSVPGRHNRPYKRSSGCCESKVMSDLLGECPGIREDDGGAVGTHDLAQPSQQASIAESAVGRLAGLDQGFDADLKRRRTRGQGGLDDATAPRRPDQEPRGRLIGPAGRRQADPAGIARRLRGDSLERDGQIGTPFRRREGMNLVDDQVLDGAPVGLPGLLAQEQREALGRRDEYVGRIVPELPPIVGRGIAGPHADPDRTGAGFQPIADPRQRLGQVALDVVIEAAKGRDVNTPEPRRQRPRLSRPKEPVENGQECGQRLPGPGRRD